MQITLNIIERHFADASPVEVEREIRFYAALGMFRAGKLSAGAATEFAEVDRFEFIEACREQDIPLVNYSPEELRSELEGLDNYLNRDSAS